MALAPHPWPGALPTWEGALLVISVVNPAGASRASARARIRAALLDVLAGALGVGQEQVGLDTAPGRAPRLLVNGAPSVIGISISHAGNLSLAAVNRHGAVGIDLMEVEDVPDWRQVASDYLGAEVAGRLAATAPAQQSHAFAQAWAEREAQLKLFGLPLSEWTQLPADCSLLTLELPSHFAGALAIQRWAHPFGQT
jgi:4'-phosphopantetheinyl transferase